MILLHQFKHDGLDTVHKHRGMMTIYDKLNEIKAGWNVNLGSLIWSYSELKCSDYNSLLETSKRNFLESRIEQATTISFSNLLMTFSQ